ncbi:VWA domain-containing protein [Streptomyces sp. NPDC059491]|uniref:VWA domain-containing protein n=1 Tax=Streptomyces sp. NPDC059491 TaxID=3346850 RepID=UPI0036AE63CD
MGIRSMLRKVFGRDREESPATSVPPQTRETSSTSPDTPEDAARRKADELVAEAFDNPQVPKARTAPTDPAPATAVTEPEPVAAETEPVAAAEEPVVAETEPEPVVAEAEPVAAADEPVAEPEPAAEVTEAEHESAADVTEAEPEPVIAETETEPVTAEEPAAAETPAETAAETEEPAVAADATEPEAVEAPEPEAVEAEAVEPEAEAEAEPEPVADVTEAEPEPVAAETEAEPEPVAAVTEAEPEPVAAVTEAEPEPVAAETETEPVAAADEPAVAADATEPEAVEAPEPEAVEEPTADAEPEAEPETEAPEPEPVVAVDADVPEGKPAVTAARLKAAAPHLAEAYRAAGAALKKEGLTGARAAVYLVVDRSGSMRGYFKDGSVQRLAEQTVALAAHLDEDASVTTVFFSTDIDGTVELTPAELTPTRVEEINGTLGRLGRTNYHRAVEEVLAHHEKADPTRPAVVVFQTDGAPESKTAAAQALADAADRPLRWRFVVWGEEENKAFDFLRKLDGTPGTGVHFAGVTPVETAHAAFYRGLLAGLEL